MSKVQITEGLAVEKSLLLYGIAVPVLLAAEYYFIEKAGAAYDQAQVYESAGLVVPENIDLAYILWSLLVLIGPPALLGKTLQIIEEDKMGDRLEKNCPNF